MFVSKQTAAVATRTANTLTMRHSPTNSSIWSPLSLMRSGLSTTSGGSRSNNNNNNDLQVESVDAVNRRLHFYPVYCQHLSRVALQHLQNRNREWVLAHGLHKGLRMNPDGTFVLHFPSSKDGQDGGRIWSSYDSSKKQHWLSVYKGQKLVGRFLLNDADATTDQQPQQPEHVTDDEDINANVRNCVDRMIMRLEELEEKEMQQQQREGERSRP